MSNLGKWEPWYKSLKPGDAPRSYGVSPTYAIGADWLLKGSCESVEDWGCGMGFFRTVWPKEYKGIDGTDSPFADIVQDLVHRNAGPYADGVFMRGVLEHDWRWREVLSNAVRAFRRRMCLVLFTPITDETKQIAFVEELGVPDISFAMGDLEPFFEGLTWGWKDVLSDTGYGRERVFYLEK